MSDEAGRCYLYIAGGANGGIVGAELGCGVGIDSYK
jgi:hypothetical protein